MSLSAANRIGQPMRELLRTTDIVLITYVNSLLKSTGIQAIIADTHVSSVEGSIGAFPRRVLVASKDWNESVTLLTEAGLAGHLTEAARPRSLTET
jgi:hypothetical protein